MKKLTRPVQKVNAPVLGLDVHQNLIAYCLLDRAGDEVESGSVGGSPQDLDELLAQLVFDRRMHVSFEACGGILWIFDALVARVGRQRVHVAQPRRIRAIANSQTKNDANDAWWLAYLTHEGRLPESFIPTGELRELRIATRERIATVRARTKVQVRLRGHLRQMGVRLPTVKITAKKGWAVLQELSAETPGTLGLVLRTLLQRFEDLEAVVAAWDEEIERLADGLPAVRTLREHVPGVGIALAATIASESGPLERFRSPKAFSRYTGLTPSDRSTSGRQIHGGITREGNANLRWALTQAAMGCLRARRGAPMAAGNWIRAKEKRMGSKAKSRVAGARKLAEQIWRLFHLGECFDAQRPFGAAT